MLRNALSTPFFAALALLPAGLAMPAQAAGDMRISGPHIHEALAVYFVHGKNADGPVPLTLKEALDQGTVKVHETGTVGELEIENTGDAEVFVHAGDIVKGGKQDRVLALSIIVPPKSGRVPITSFCVEQGRWAARGAEDVTAFASADAMMPSREAKLAMRAPVSAQPASPAMAALSPQGAGTGTNRMSILPGIQREIWNKVGDIHNALSKSTGEKVSATESESSLQLALEHGKVVAAKAAYSKALKGTGERDGDIIGYVFAINGKVNSAEIYGSNELFRKLWPRLLEASATEAMGHENAIPKYDPPAASRVRSFLDESAKATATDRTVNEATKLSLRQSRNTVDLETRRASGGFLHRSILAR